MAESCRIENRTLGMIMSVAITEHTKRVTITSLLLTRGARLMDIQLWGGEEVKYGVGGGGGGYGGILASL